MRYFAYILRISASSDTFQNVEWAGDVVRHEGQEGVSGDGGVNKLYLALSLARSRSCSLSPSLARSLSLSSLSLYIYISRSLPLSSLALSLSLAHSLGVSTRV